MYKWQGHVSCSKRRTHSLSHLADVKSSLCEAQSLAGWDLGCPALRLEVPPSAEDVLVLDVCELAQH